MGREPSSYFQSPNSSEIHGLAFLQASSNLAIFGHQPGMAWFTGSAIQNYSKLFKLQKGWWKQGRNLSRAAASPLLTFCSPLSIS